MKRIALAALTALIAGCGSSDSSGDSTSTNETCVTDAKLSGAVEGSFSGQNLACVYSSSVIGFSRLDNNETITISFQSLGKGQTGVHFAATVGVSVKSQRWTGAECVVDISSNDKIERLEGASSADRYLLKGSGSCSTPATLTGDAGTRLPVTIAPFTFTSPVLFN